MVSRAIKTQIREMRKTGFSIREIALEIHHSKSTVAKYIKDIPIQPEYYNIWHAKIGGNTTRAKDRKLKAEKEAENLLGSLTLRDQLIIASCLYWAEGNKRDFNFTNTDPKLIETFLECLRSLGVTQDRIKVSIRVYEDINVKKAKQYWARIAGISPSQICSVNVLQGKKKGKLLYGMCRVRLTKGNDYFNFLTGTIRLIGKKYAPVAQRIEPRTPKP